jgi:Dual specificity phosphatase, catalytic domain
VGTEVYMAISPLALATVYGLRETVMSVEDVRLPGIWSLIGGAILLPYSALGAITLYISRWFDREGLFSSVAPDIYVGRLPFPFELARLRAAGIDAVLNLCWEFPRLSGADRTPNFVMAQVPILDGSPPSDTQFYAAVHQVAQWRAEGRCVLIHCAQGHGRTATITGATLIHLRNGTQITSRYTLFESSRHTPCAVIG